MPHTHSHRRRLTLSLMAAPFGASAVPVLAVGAERSDITSHGAVADDKTVNTAAIQQTIDGLAARGGGTVVVPAGVFVSGALFFKPGVHLHLAKGAVLKCSTDLKHFPARRTRIEGHFAENFNPALVNADGCDGFHLSGEGTLDGAGRPIWDRFWKLRNAYKDPGNFPNISVPRARLALIERSRGVTVEGVTFKDSQFWNLHLYRCQDVTVKHARFVVPDDYKQAPSTDGIDLDSCQRVTIDGCYFSVTDDCIAAKGSKGPFALQDKDSPPVTDVRVRNCEFRRGHSVITLGSEATLVRDILVEDCRVTGHVLNVAVLKLRPDTPQHYENVHLRNLVLQSERGAIVSVQPWTQYVDLKGVPPPKSIVRDIRLEGITGRYGGFGRIRPNPGQTEISDIVFKDIELTLRDPRLDIAGATGVRLDNVIVNGKKASL
ncbi:glycoside hydrolase family 28 protein [Massilia sp. CFBP9026]|uniref:glycoside hydrolase family 28 protein n=1 Tax=Massilia sp. CFBP9026 TaxID=3096536 RepID=UPI002A69B546|nr:glycosyl hydrolase family 28 protein [Massilia sp. CFBP9026]MDY0961023.1 glycosyl hydrolase family 28 protein [Massilia sp. CFBP9026]